MIVLDPQPQTSPDVVEILIDVGETLGSGMSLEDSLERLADLAMRATGAERCGVFLTEQADASALPRLTPIVGAARAGNRDGIRERFKRTPAIRIEGDPAKLRLWEKPETVTIDDAQSSEIIPDEWKHLGSRSVAFSSLRAGGEHFGLIAVDYVERAHTFTEDERRLLDAIACAAGIALRNSQLVDQVQRGIEVERRLFECCAALHSDDAAGDVLELVADGFVSLLRVPHCWIHLLSPDETRLLPVVRRGGPADSRAEFALDELPADGVASIRAVWERDRHRPIVIPNVPSLVEWRHLVPPEIDVGLLVPLPDGDRISGFVVAGRRGEVFTTEEVRLASAFAAQAAVAVSRARMNEALQHRLSAIEALHALSQAVIGSADVRSVVSALAPVCDAVGVQAPRIAFRDAVLREILRVPVPSAEEDAVLKRWRRRVDPRAVLEPVTLGSDLLLPIAMERSIAGVLRVRPRGPLTGEALEVLRAIAAGVGEVAYKAKLRRSAERRTLELAVGAERERIARDLHDTVGQIFYGIALKLDDTLNRIEDPDVELILNEARGAASRGVAEVRSAVYALSFLHVRAKGLMPALRSLVDQFGRTTGIAALLHIRGRTPRLPEETVSALYRTAHEALINVERHARATGVVVSLTALDGAVQLEIRDDGVGLDQRVARDWRSAAHFGLRTMARVIHEVGGTFSAVNAEPRGLLITASIPVGRRRG